MNKYSTFNDTSIKLSGKKIKKKFILKTIPKKYEDRVSCLIAQYYNQLKSAGVSLPRLYKKNKLNFTFEFCGESLLNKLSKRNVRDLFIDDVLEQIIMILRKCVKNKIPLDPHIKNFTINDGIVYYVDTFPPVLDDYINLLTRYNSPNKSFILRHLNTFKYDKIMYHFLADLKKTKTLNNKIYMKSKSLFIKRRFIRNFSLKKLNKIIEIEHNNSKRKQFTLS